MSAENNLDLQKQKSYQSQKISKAKAVTFFQGCKYKKCISLHCLHFIGEKSLTEIRNNPQENLSAVLELIGENELKMDCAIDEPLLPKLPQAFQIFTCLFSFDFNRLINCQSSERVKYFNDLQTEIDQLLMPEDGDFKLKTILYFEEHMKTHFQSIITVLDLKIKNFDFFETIVLLFITFRCVFEVDLFSEHFFIKQIFHNLNFWDIFCPEIQKQLTKSPIYSILNKKNISKTNEDLQNLLTLCYPSGDEFLKVSGKLRRFNMTVLCNSIEFLMNLNSLLPFQVRMPIKEFTNPTLSEDLSDKQATIFFIASQESHPMLKFLKMDNLTFESENEVNYLKYPFLLTVDRRVDVLNQESLLFQKAEMIGSLGGNFFAMLMQNNLYLQIQLRRQHILEDTLTQLSKGSNKSNLRKQLKITFAGEPGVDEGGVKKEFFTLLIQQLFDPNFGMFIEKNGRFLWFQSDSFECSLNFELIGLLLGLALYNEVILSLKFPMAVYKKLITAGSNKCMVSDQLTLEDLAEIDPDIFTTLNNLLTKDWTDKETGFLFVLSYETYGEVKEIELIPDGANVKVTEENKRKFIDLYIDWYFNKSIEKQFGSFAAGFFQVILKDSFKLFNAEDLLLAICGSTMLDFTMLKKTALYENYTSNSETIVMFWNILINEFDHNQQKEFLKFLTGSDRAPIRGLGDIKVIITKTGDSNSLPSAHTCFNHLILPDYKDYEKLKAKLLKAIENCEGFGLF